MVLPLATGNLLLKYDHRFPVAKGINKPDSAKVREKIILSFNYPFSVLKPHKQHLQLRQR